MPLIKGKSPKAFEHNLKTEMHADKPLKQSLAIAYAMKRKAKKMAGGGFVQGEEASGYHSMPEEHEMHNESAMMEDDKDLNQHEVMAHAGMPEEHEVDVQMEAPKDDFSEEDRLAYGDVVGRIMHRRMSEGGKVANATPPDAEFESNEFDDLVKDDDLHSTYGQDDNAGDALGNAQEDEDRRDIVARIMRQRSMKQHNPRPA